LPFLRAGIEVRFRLNVMQKEVCILIAEDDDGHASLIERNLRRAGVHNRIERFVDGQQVLDYLHQQEAKASDAERTKDEAFLLLLDINMPKRDGIDVLTEVKMSPVLRKIPVIMITTTDDPREVDKCHQLGCNSYVTKPVEYEGFVNAIRQLGLFLMVVEVPKV